MSSIYAVLILFLNLPVSAHEPRDGDIRAATAFTVNRNIPTDHEYHPETLSSFGAVVEADIDYHGGPELTALYTRQMYSIQKDGLIHNELGKRMYVGLGYRHWFNRRFSMGGAFFSSYAMGDPQVIYSEFGSSPAPKTSARDSTDYGFEASVAADIFIWDEWAFMAAGRYSRSVTSKPGESADFYSALFALKYLIQKR